MLKLCHHLRRPARLEEPGKHHPWRRHGAAPLNRARPRVPVPVAAAAALVGPLLDALAVSGAAQAFDS